MNTKFCSSATSDQEKLIPDCLKRKPVVVLERLPEQFVQELQKDRTHSAGSMEVQLSEMTTPVELSKQQLVVKAKVSSNSWLRHGAVLELLKRHAEASETMSTPHKEQVTCNEGQELIHEGPEPKVLKDLPEEESEHQAEHCNLAQFTPHNEQATCNEGEELIYEGPEPKVLKDLPKEESEHQAEHCNLAQFTPHKEQVTEWTLSR